MGISAELKVEEMPAPFGVYAHNWPAFALWVGVWRQWRWIPAGLAGAVRDGLDWVQVEAVMRMDGVPKRARRHLRQALRTMQDAAIAEMADMADSK